MKQKVDDVISHDAGSAPGIVDRQGKVDHWSSVRPGRAQWRNHDPRDGPQMPDGWIIDDGGNVVEYKGTGEAVVVGSEGRQDDEKETTRRCEGRLANTALSVGRRLVAGI